MNNKLKKVCGKDLFKNSEKAKEMMQEIQLQEDYERAKEVMKHSGNLSKKRNKKGQLMLRRIVVRNVEDYGEGKRHLKNNDLKRRRKRDL